MSDNNHWPDFYFDENELLNPNQQSYFFHQKMVNHLHLDLHRNEEPFHRWHFLLDNGCIPIDNTRKKKFILLDKISNANTSNACFDNIFW
jgi:hypothetical protein